MWRRHIDQIRKIGQNTPKERYLPDLPVDLPKNDLPVPSNLPDSDIPKDTTNSPDLHNNETSVTELEPGTTSESVSDKLPLRRSHRIRKAPDRLDL